MKPTYKRIAEADIPVLIGMMRDFYAIDDYPIDEQRSEQLFRQFISQQNLGAAWMIISDGNVAGYTILTYIFSFEFAGLIAFVDELYIKEDYRGRSIGKHTMEFLKEAASDAGIKRLYLEVEQHNKIAQELYKSAGFTEHNRMFMQHKIN